MSLNRLLLVFSKSSVKLNLKRYITTSQYLRIKLNQNLFGGSSHHNHGEASKSNIDEKLIARLAAQDPLTDKSELDKHEWERSTRNVRKLSLSLLLLNNI